MRGPLLLTAGTADHTAPARVTREVLALHKDSGSASDYLEFEGRGHSLTIDSGWEEVATATIAWLTEKGL